MMSTCGLSSTCAGTSLGAGSQLFLALIQTLFEAQCGLSPEAMWPPDHAEIALKEGA